MAARGQTFEALFGASPAVRARAPGRVNLVGEHTDYNEGFVLPMAIPQETRVELRPTGGAEVRAWSVELAHAGVLTYRLGEEARGRGWLDYVQGVTQVLARDGLAPGGFDLRVESDVPVGSGLSSSAALEVALLRALREAFRLPLDDVALALAGQRAEAGLVGAPVGVMDQLAASLADTRAALFVDTRSLAHRRVPLPDGLRIAVIGSGVAHAHAGGDYRRRRAECERAAALLGVRALRDVADADLLRALSLPDPLGRRVRHVVTENARVLELVRALEGGELDAAGEIADASHRSQRNDFEVSIAEIDLLVALLRREPGVLGARLTGGGFGGSVVAFARAGAGAAAAARAVAAYGERSGRVGAVLVPRSPG